MTESRAADARRLAVIVVVGVGALVGGRIRSTPPSDSREVTETEACAASSSIRSSFVKGFARSARDPFTGNLLLVLFGLITAALVGLLVGVAHHVTSDLVRFDRRLVSVLLALPLSLVASFWWRHKFLPRRGSSFVTVCTVPALLLAGLHDKQSKTAIDLVAIVIAVALAAQVVLLYRKIRSPRPFRSLLSGDQISAVAFWQLTTWSLYLAAPQSPASRALSLVVWIVLAILVWGLTLVLCAGSSRAGPWLAAQMSELDGQEQGHDAGPAWLIRYARRAAGFYRETSVSLAVAIALVSALFLVETAGQDPLSPLTVVPFVAVPFLVPFWPSGPAADPS